MADAKPVTEAEWTTGDELWRMLHQTWKAGLFSARKQFLYCVGTCRLHSESLPEEYLPILLGLEAFADRGDLPACSDQNFLDYHSLLQVTESDDPYGEQLSALHNRAWDIRLRRFAANVRPGEPDPDEFDPRFRVDEIMEYVVKGHTWASSFGDGNGNILRSAVEANLLRDLFGNIFRPVAVDPVWLTSDVLRLATGIYEDKAFDRMPILADALQDAGCDNEDVLNHLRGEGQHYRGCWALDLVLGKS